MDASWDSSYLLDGQEIDKINICLLSDYMESQYFFLITMLRTLDQLIKYHSDGTQDNDGRYNMNRWGGEKLKFDKIFQK